MSEQDITHLVNVIEPEYYVNTKIQPLDVIEDWGLDFSLGCVIKYIKRYKQKGGTVDLNKAQYYLDRFVRLEEKKP
jgi:hypothetical protein